MGGAAVGRPGPARALGVRALRDGAQPPPMVAVAAGLPRRPPHRRRFDAEIPSRDRADTTRPHRGLRGRRAGVRRLPRRRGTDHSDPHRGRDLRCAAPPVGTTTSRVGDGCARVRRVPRLRGAVDGGRVQDAGRPAHLRRREEDRGGRRPRSVAARRRGRRHPRDRPHESRLPDHPIPAGRSRRTHRRHVRVRPVASPNGATRGTGHRPPAVAQRHGPQPHHGHVLEASRVGAALPGAPDRRLLDRRPRRPRR